MEPNETYEIYRFAYKAKGGRILHVFARRDEVADEIVRMENVGLPYPWKRKRIGFRKLVKVNTPPYELECDQINVARSRMERRIRG